jgi:hypothetical protein
MTVLEFGVPGKPVPQGSKRIGRNRATGRRSCWTTTTGNCGSGVTPSRSPLRLRCDFKG